jgi:hypothetical protein
MKQLINIGLVFLCVMLFLFGLFIGKFYKLPIANTPAEFGEFGSFIGGIFGSFAVIISILAILQTNKINTRQNEQFENQLFESCFFNLVSLFNQRIDSLNLKDSNITGNAVFDYLLQKFKTKTDSYFTQPQIFKTLMLELINEDYKNEFSILILPIKSITGFIENSSVSKELKQQYVLILFSFLTISEIEIMNRIAKFDIEIKNLMDKFSNSLLN